MSSIVSDIVCIVDGGATKWQAIYIILEDEEPEVVEVKETANDQGPHIYSLNMSLVPFFIE